MSGGAVRATACVSYTRGTFDPPSSGWSNVSNLKITLDWDDSENSLTWGELRRFVEMAKHLPDSETIALEYDEENMRHTGFYLWLPPTTAG